MRKGGLWSEEFTERLFCDVEFWIGKMDNIAVIKPPQERIGTNGIAVLKFAP